MNVGDEVLRFVALSVGTDDVCDAAIRFDETNLKLAATLGDVAVLEPSGIHKDLELGAGATLTSSGTMAMPIFGTLKGTGMLQGQFAFAGDDNCWEVEGVDSVRELKRAQFADASAETFRELRAVKATFNLSNIKTDSKWETRTTPNKKFTQVSPETVFKRIMNMAK